VDDEKLMTMLIKQQIPLTVCPLSNTKLQVFKQMSEHNIVELLRKGLAVTINSDDPAYFGGYLNANFQAVAAAHVMTPTEIAQFTRNAIQASFINEAEKQVLQLNLDSYLSAQPN